MNGKVPRSTRGIVALLILILILASIVPPGSGATLPCCPNGDPSIGITRFHQIDIMQGDHPETPDQEPGDQVVVTDRTFWSIPWNNSEVYTYIPPEATDISIDHVDAIEEKGTSMFVPGRFSSTANPVNAPSTGWVVDGNYSGFHSWEFPKEVDRDLLLTLDWDTPADFKDFDPEATSGEDWDTSGGTLILLPEVSSSTYVSKSEVVGFDLLSVEMTWEGTNTDHMGFQVSADNGTTWMDAVNGVVMDMPGPGNVVRWRVEVSRQGPIEEDQVLDRITIDLKYRPEWNDIWLETSYTLQLSDGALDFDFSFPFDGDGTGFILHAHFDQMVKLDVEGTELESQEETFYIGKTTHVRLSGDYTSLVTFSVDENPEPGKGDPQDLPWTGVTIIIALVGGVIIIMFWGRQKNESLLEGSEDAEDYR